MCFLFVFSAILEYAFVSYLVFKQREQEREKIGMKKKHDEVSLDGTIFSAPTFF